MLGFVAPVIHGDVDPVMLGFVAPVMLAFVVRAAPENGNDGECGGWWQRATEGCHRFPVFLAAAAFMSVVSARGSLRRGAISLRGFLPLRLLVSCSLANTADGAFASPGQTSPSSSPQSVDPFLHLALGPDPFVPVAVDVAVPVIRFAGRAGSGSPKWTRIARNPDHA